MAEEQQGAATQEAPATDAAENAVPTNGDAAGQQAPGARTFTQADVDRMIAERLDRAKHQAETAAHRARADAERKAAEEQGKYQELYEGLRGELEREQAARKTLELSNLRRDAAAKVGLSAALAERLRGETADELEADAKQMLADMPKPAAPNINATGGGPAPASGYSEAERQHLAALLGVNPKYFGKAQGA